MGLAANQARLLTLQSRMNDLELRCMQLSNQKITNTIKTSNLSIQYNKKLEEANAIGAKKVTVVNTTEGWRTCDNPTQTLKLNQGGSNVSFNYNMLKEMGYEIAPKGSVANVTNTADTDNKGTTTKTVTTPAVDSHGRKNVTQWQMPTTAAEFKQLLESAGLIDDSTGSGNTSSQGLTLNKWLDASGLAVKSEDAGTVSKTNLKTLASNFTVGGQVSDDPNQTLNFDKNKLAKLLGTSNSVEASSTSTTNSVGSAAKSIEAGNYDMPTNMNELMNLLTGVDLLGKVGSRSYANADGSLSDVRIKSNVAFQLTGSNEVNTENYYSMADIAKMFAKNASDVKDNDFKKSVEFDYNKLASIIGESAKIGSAQTSTTTSSRNYQGVTSYGEGTTTVSVPAENTTTETTPSSSTISYESNDLIESAKKDSQTLISGIMAGNIGIYKDGQEVSLSEVGIVSHTDSNASTERWFQTQTLESLDYSERDNARQAAQSWYDSHTAILSQQEKVLDVQMKSANTEYQAATTEYESIKQLISDNTDRGFSIFS